MSNKLICNFHIKIIATVRRKYYVRVRARQESYQVGGYNLEHQCCRL